jgi:tetratricopeptide (TPR) repeat protein
VEIFAPTQVALRTRRGVRPGRPRTVTAALTAGALWIQDTWQLRRVPLQTLDKVETRRKGKELALSFRPETADEGLTLTFASAAEGRYWSRELQERQPVPAPEAPPGDRPVPEGVALVRQAPDLPYVALGRVAFTDRTPRAADRGLQLRAGMRGADAVIELTRHKCPDLGVGGRHASGLAVRVQDDDARQRLRLRWYAEEVCGLVNRLALLLVLQAALLFVAGVFCAGLTRFHPATGETLPEALVSAAWGLGLVFAWPLILLALLRVLRRPQLLRTVGVAALAATTGRTVVAWLAHLLAAGARGAAPGAGNLWVLVDPIDWAFVVAGVVLCVRAWRLSADARQILPQAVQAAWAAGKAWPRGLGAVTAVYALLILGFVGVSRFQTSTHLLHPGVDPRREHEALLALNEGAALANQGNLDAADRSLQRSLRLWEGLTAERSAPPVYRANLALALSDLGWLRQRQGRPGEAEKYYARAVALADDRAGAAPPDDEFVRIVADAREALAGLRRESEFKQLEEKDREAARKYEEAQVKSQKGDAEAERLFREAIGVWEEILPQATNPDYQKGATGRLALGYLHVAELQQQRGKRSEAEAALKKSIDYGEKAVALDPGRPLPRHNLEVARQMLEGLREQGLQEEVDRLCAAQRFADAVERCARGVADQEEQVRSGKDREAAVRRLAYRLDRLAWLLAHCPDGNVRDTREAVRHARRAAELQPDVTDYGYTLATAQYRNGDWRDSLASLERLKARAGGLNACGWFLVAMARHQLKQREEARAALRQAAEWIGEQQRKAEDDALLRFQYEMMRPAIEGLKREAEGLIEGKGPAGQRAA